MSVVDRKNSRKRATMRGLIHSSQPLSLPDGQACKYCTAKQSSRSTCRVGLLPRKSSRGRTAMLPTPFAVSEFQVPLSGELFRRIAILGEHPVLEKERGRDPSSSWENSSITMIREASWHPRDKDMGGTWVRSMYRGVGTRHEFPSTPIYRLGGRFQGATDASRGGHVPDEGPAVPFPAHREATQVAKRPEPHHTR